ncbi:MAG: hypothetical protein V3V99_14075 [candidate division Zixibacteria bacterium]
MPKFFRQGISNLIITFFLICCVNATSAQDITLWGNLEPGPHGIGFKSFERYDYSRVYRARLDYFGNPVEGETARPIQICVWYPAKTMENSITMVYGEYSYSYPENDEFINLLTQLHNREIGYIVNATQQPAGFALEIMGKDLKAVRDADPEEGSFPLVIYCPRYESSYCENAVLCEYLASHGFIVATTHPLGQMSATPEYNQIGLESTARDAEFVLGFLHDFPNVDYNKIGILGSGAGGATAVLVKLRNQNVKATATLAGSLTFGMLQELVRQNPAYSPERLSGPLMNLYPTGEHEPDFSLLDSLIFASRYSFAFPSNSYQDFNMGRSILSMLSDSTEQMHRQRLDGYKMIADHVYRFFDAFLNDDSASMAFIENMPLHNGYDLEFVRREFRGAEDLPPTQNQLMALFTTGQIAAGLDLYDKFIALYPDMYNIPMQNFNVLGYQLLQQNRIDESLRVFKIVADNYPNVANSWDSYADACLVAGDTTMAIQCYKNVLEALPDDTSANEDFRQQLRNIAENFLSQIEEN